MSDRVLLTTILRQNNKITMRIVFYVGSQTGNFVCPFNTDAVIVSMLCAYKFDWNISEDG